MSSYYERYLRGERAAVWEELSGLGEAVFAEPLHADALAVGRETMRRVRLNILTLIGRLRTLGYEFGYERPRHDLEPLWARPIAYYIANLPFWDPRAGAGVFRFAPAEAARQGFPGADPGGESHVDVPSLEADGVLWGVQPDEPFVSYLRRVVRWGGFPGLERRARQPTRELAILTEGLLPF